MKCIGIIGAMEQEVAKIKEKMQDVAQAIHNNEEANKNQYR